MIEIDNLSKSYRHRSWRQLLCGRPARRIVALSDLSLSVARGEVLGLLGPNGAGKSTLLKIIATLVAPDTGQIRLAGRDMTGHTSWVKRRVGLVSGNERSFYWRLTGRQNLEFFGRLHGLAGRQLQQRPAELLDLVGLENKADLPFSGWSTGQRQRLAIARALLGDPEVLLLDEPTAGLDPQASQQILELTRNRLTDRQRLVIWCSHDLPEVRQISDRVAILKQGQLVYCGPLADVAKADTSISCRVDIAPCPEDWLHALPWRGHCRQETEQRWQLDFSVTEMQIPELLEAMIAAGIRVFACRPQPPTLEDLYSRLTEEDTP